MSLKLPFFLQIILSFEILLHEFLAKRKKRQSDPGFFFGVGGGWNPSQETPPPGIRWRMSASKHIPPEIRSRLSATIHTFRA